MRRRRKVGRVRDKRNSNKKREGHGGRRRNELRY
jgi:hypothetical protein